MVEKKKYKKMVLNLDPLLANRLDQIAKENYSVRAKIVRRALDEFLKNWGKK